ELLLLDEPTSGLDPLMEQRFRECIEQAKRRGQTVFLSSHILSEVEALCDRVAILRQGELLEIGSLAEMRHLSSLSVEATFEGPPPDVSGVPGAQRGGAAGCSLVTRITRTLQSPLSILVQACAGDLRGSETSLE